MSDSDEAVRRQVFEAATRLHEATAACERMFRRRDFAHELHEKGNWLAAGQPRPDPPEWVQRWSTYWEELKTNPEYIRLQHEARAAHEALHTPEFEHALELLQLGDTSGIEYAVAYLEADPWYFRSGYLKGRIARWLRQVPLSESQAARLRKVILDTLQKGSRYEQVEYRKLARRLDTPPFREDLLQLTKAKDANTAHRAELALRFCQLNDTPGRDLRGAR